MRMNIIEAAHDSKVLQRRIRVLSDYMAKLIPPQASVLDVGCGSGQIDKLILKQRDDITIDGIDVLVRDNTEIEVAEYDGCTFPCEDNSYDVVMFVDVLHHTDNLEQLLGEARRVARQFVIIKDHTPEGMLSRARLNFMDSVGNRRFGVRLTYNYYTESQWLEAFKKNGLSVDSWNRQLRLYPWPFSMVFDSTLHFIARLKTESSTS